MKDFQDFSMFHNGRGIDSLADSFRNSSWPSRLTIFGDHTPISNEMSDPCLQIQSRVSQLQDREPSCFMPLTPDSGR